MCGASISCAIRCPVHAPDTAIADESTRRLRALVRATLSSGVWAVIALQVVMGLTLRGSADDAGAAALLRFAVLVAATAAVLYGTAGVSAALAAGREPVSVVTALDAGRAVFGGFLWLIAKASLLATAILQVALIALVAGAGQDANQAATQLPSHMLPLAALSGFALVYWLPLVFYRRDFRLFATLAEALRLLWGRAHAAGFLALLTLAPAALAWILDGRGGAITAFLLQAVASLLAWAAYVYCVEWLQDTLSPKPAPIS